MHTVIGGDSSVMVGGKASLFTAGGKSYQIAV